MPRFSLPDWLKKHQYTYTSLDEVPEEVFAALRSKLERFKCEQPEVSVLMPVWNEEENLLRTLSTFADQTTNRKVELVLMNNNSTDRTQEIIDRCGVKSVFVPTQGISHARQAGLEIAKGIYHLCSDGDSFYPPGWIDAMVNELQNPETSVAHGRHSFIPTENSGRFILGLYELLAETLFDIRRKNREYLNVLGFNFAFRTADGRKVGGFNTTRPRWSDGWMAMTLMSQGKIVCLNSDDARVWTSARRLIADGSLSKAFKRRIKKEIVRLKEYFVNPPIKLD